MIEKQINGKNTKNMRSLVSQVWSADKLKKHHFPSWAVSFSLQL